MIIKGDLGSLELEVLTEASELNPGVSEFYDFEVSILAHLDIRFVTANVPLGIELQELRQFEIEFSKFLKLQIKEIEFDPIESDIYLHFKLTETGHIDILGRLKTPQSNELTFNLTNELATLDRLLIDLKIVINSFK